MPGEGAGLCQMRGRGHAWLGGGAMPGEGAELCQVRRRGCA